ncbi:DUF1080 domain-containing protein [Opitutus sp. GAS368]|jgi:hypothetical protein|uniref:3-keto-disaccharide hydrolase n=1 Tax=Opitutus sp. GAS368 TaxID=1882749 RepID=UPI00087C051A|nr:DUF1080 domain-containing protein [Opitutus sp. GAS368]SDR82183.1 protein of unknown function [Opitutus sp. GAS368]
MKTKFPVLAAFCALLAALPAAEMNTLTPAESAAGWHLLFDGKSIADWRASDQPGTFSVAAGEIVVKGPRSHLFYEGPVANHDFKNFELSVEVLTKPKANSGVYFHTEWQPEGWPAKGFEVQVNNTHSDPKRTAGLYGIKDTYDQVAKDNVWFTMFIRVEGRHIVTSVDGKVIIDYTEPENWTPPANFPGRRVAHGTFALQGHDPGSETHFRNLKIRPLP